MIAHTDLRSSAAFSARWLHGFGRALLDLVFPPRCVSCHRFGSWFCDPCLADVELIRPPVCSRCGMPYEGVPAHGEGSGAYMGFVCDRCSVAPPLVDGLRAAAFHTGPMRKAIHEFKYGDLRVLAEPLGALMASAWSELMPGGASLDAVVPVPLHAARERQRGYNQAALLAREVGQRLALPVVPNVLLRVRATAPQVGLDAHARRANVQDAFRCRSTALEGKRVLLVDDVLTTGATLEAACAALRDGGAIGVWALAAARAR